MTKLELILFFLVLSTVGAAENTPIKIMKEDVETEESLFNLYERFLRHHSLHRDHNEKMLRFQLFKEVVLYIYQHNTRTDVSDDELALYEFADLTDKEFRAYYTGYKPDPWWLRLYI